MKILLKVGKFIIKGLAAVGGGVAAVSVAGISVVGSNYAIALSGAVAICSAISSAVKDKNPRPIVTTIMKLINFFAVNIDNAENDKKVNELKKNVRIQSK
jgi:hypothetical protein